MRELFRKPVTPSTFGEIAVGLRNHIEFDDMAFLVAFLLSDDESVQKLYQENTSPETWNWLRLMLALYGEATKEAQTISGKNEDAWRVANRRVYFDTVTNQWGVTLEIIKYNGEKITLEETPRDALFLAEGIVNALNTVPPDAMAEESLIPREDVRYFLADVITLSENYAPGLLVELAQEVAKEEQQAESGQVMEEWAKGILLPDWGYQVKLLQYIRNRAIPIQILHKPQFLSGEFVSFHQEEPYLLSFSTTFSIDRTSPFFFSYWMNNNFHLDRCKIV